MNKYLLGFLFLIPFVTHAQQKDSTTIYYDKHWEILVDDGPEAVYFRKAIKKEDTWYVKDYYKDSKTLQMTGAFRDYLDSAKVGGFKWYFENGTLKEEGDYINGKRDGIWKEWFDNGKKKYVGNYKEGYLVGNFESWWKNGNKYCEIRYLDDIDKIRSYERKDSAGKTIERLGIEVGTSKYYFENGVMSAKEEWENDSLVALQLWNEKGVAETPERNGKGAFIADVVPTFKGGIPALMQYLSTNIKYPKQSRRRNETGKSFIQFVVNSDGSIQRVEVYKSSGFPLLDEEAMRVVKTMNGMWIPGKQHNQPVSVYFTLPVTYRLQE